MSTRRPDWVRSGSGSVDGRPRSARRTLPAGLAYWGFWGAGAAALTVPTVVWAVHSRDAALAAARDDAPRVAAMAARYADNTFGLVDVVLGGLAEVAAEKDIAGKAGGRLCPSFVCSADRRPSPYLLLGFVRADGEVVDGEGVRRLNLADRDYFLAQKDADAGLVVGAPRKSPFMEGTALPMSRRLATKDGPFGGIVAAAVNADVIRDGFRGLATGKADQVNLLGPEGRILVRWVADPEIDGPGPGTSGRDPDCRAETSPSIDASARLRTGALAVETCRSEANILHPWRRNVAFAAAVEALILVGAAIALPTLRRRTEARLRRQKALSGLVAATSDVQFIIAARPDGSFVLEALTFSQAGEWGGMAARLVGRTTRELFAPDDADAMDADYRSVLASGETRRIERRIRLGGAEFVWSTLLVPLPDAGYVLGAASDLAGEAPLEGGLRAFTGDVLRREDNERRRIARELHDTTGQNLIAAGFELRTVALGLGDAPPRVRTALAEARKLVEASAAELRTLSYVLYPPLLDEAGLGLALTTLAEGFGKRAGLKVSVLVAEEVAERRWPPEVELALYRVAQEALTNVQRHAREKEARIVLRAIAPGRVGLDVENGAGEAACTTLASGHVTEGTGIRGMRDRLEALGGSLTVTRTDSGFRVSTVVPAEPVPGAAG